MAPHSEPFLRSEQLWPHIWPMVWPMVSPVVSAMVGPTPLLSKEMTTRENREWERYAQHFWHLWLFAWLPMLPSRSSSCCTKAEQSPSTTTPMTRSSRSTSTAGTFATRLCVSAYIRQGPFSISSDQPSQHALAQGLHPGGAFCVWGGYLLPTGVSA
jgi:hypothetical protein